MYFFREFNLEATV